MDFKRSVKYVFMKSQSKALEYICKPWPKAFEALHFRKNWFNVYRLVLETKEKKVEECLIIPSFPLRLFLLFSPLWLLCES